MSDAFHVCRSHLKSACETQNWDLLDKLLEQDRTHIDDNSLFTDTWGEWWGLLIETIRLDSEAGLRVLLKHGAQRNLASWGDGVPHTPEETAAGEPALLALLRDPAAPEYMRNADPSLPFEVSPNERTAERQGDIRDSLGLVFPSQTLEEKHPENNQ